MILIGITVELWIVNAIEFEVNIGYLNRTAPAVRPLLVWLLAADPIRRIIND